MRGLIIFCLSVISFASFGQNRTTVQDGPWGDPATWGATPPTSGVGLITVNHDVTVDADVYPIATPLRVDQLTVGASGTLTITTGAAMRVLNGSLTDLNVQGSFTVNSGAELLANRSATYNTTAANTTFLAGSVHRTVANTIPIASGLQNATIYIQDATSSLTMGGSWAQSLGTVIIDCPGLTTRTINGNGNLIDVQDLQIIDTDGSLGGRFTFNSVGTSTHDIGNFSVTGDSRLFGTVSGNITLNITGSFSFNSTATNFSSFASTGAATINFSDDCTISSGAVRLTNGTGGNTFLNFLSSSDLNVQSPATISANGTGAQASVSFLGNGAQALNIDPASLGAGIFNLIINKPAGNLTLSEDITLTGLALTQGNFLLNGNSLTVMGAISQSAGILVSPAASSVSIIGGGAVPAQLLFSDNSILSQLTLHRAVTLNIANSPTAASDLEISTLNLTSGTLAKSAGTLTISDQGLITRTAGSITASITSAGQYDVLYLNTAAMASASELPVSTTVLRNLTKQGSGALTLSSSVTINGNLSVQDGSVNGSTFNVSLVGDFLANSSVTMSPTSTFTFLDRTPSNVHSLSGTATPIFGHVVVNGALTATCSHRLFGNLTTSSTGSLQVNSATTTIGGTTLITKSGLGAINFNSIVLSATSQLTGPLAGTISISGDLSGSGTFNHNNGTVVFNGASTVSGLRTFKNVTINIGSSLTAASTNLEGDVINNGSVSLTGLLTWNESGTLSGTPTLTSLFNLSVAVSKTLTITLSGNILVNAAVTLNGNIDHQTSNTISIATNMTGNGNFSSQGTVAFSGVTSSMQGSGNKSFTNLQLAGTHSIGTTTNYSMIGTGSLTVNGVLNSTTGNQTTTFAGVTALSGGGTINFRHVVITNSLTSATGNVTVNGNFTNNGGFNSNNGTITFGTVAGQKIISGSQSVTFNNLNVSNNGTAVDLLNNIATGQSINIAGTMTLANNTVVDADGSTNLDFVLLSTGDTPTVDGTIAALPAGANVSGLVTVQRFMKAFTDPLNDNSRYRYTSMPVQNVALAQFQDDITASLASIRWYNEAKSNFPQNNRWTRLATAGEELVIGRGYEVWMYANAIQTLDFRGDINSGPIPLPVSHNASAPPIAGADGWNLVGNPYPSSVVWDGNPTNWTFDDQLIASTAYVPDENADVFRAYNYFDGSGNDGQDTYPLLTGGVIATGQAFWVYVLPGASLTVNETAKVSSGGAGHNFYRRGGPEPLNQLSISLEGNNVKDYTFFKINAKATHDLDLRYDAPKLRNEKQNIYLVDNLNREMGMHTVPSMDDLAEVYIGYDVIQEGKYSINFSTKGDLSALAGWNLLDRDLGTSIPFSENLIYTFDVSSEKRSSSTRFVLTRNPSEESYDSQNVIVYPNPTSDYLHITSENDILGIQIKDINGRTILTKPNEGTDSKHMTIDVRNIQSGVYLVSVNNGGMNVVNRFIKR